MPLAQAVIQTDNTEAFSRELGLQIYYLLNSYVQDDGQIEICRGSKGIQVKLKFFARHKIYDAATSFTYYEIENLSFYQLYIRRAFTELAKSISEKIKEK